MQLKSLSLQLQSELNFLGNFETFWDLPTEDVDDGDVAIVKAALIRGRFCDGALLVYMYKDGWHCMRNHTLIMKENS